MQYVLIHNDTVINGPREWNARSFESSLYDDVGILFNLPVQKTDSDPIILTENTKIISSTYVYPNYNQKIEYLDGPFWNFDNNFATGTFIVKDQPIEFVKQSLKQRLASNRYNREGLGTKTTIQNIEISVDTSREGRAIFVQAYSIMQDETTLRWKFPEAWLILTKPELAQIVTVGAQYVEQCFGWECDVSNIIDQCTTLEELNQVDIGDPIDGEVV